MSCKLKYTLLPGIVNPVYVCYLSSILFSFLEILTMDIIFMVKELVLTFSNQFLLQDCIRIVRDDSSTELENKLH